MSTLIEVIGWYGVVAIIAAYFLSSFGKISTQSTIYQLLNLTGAISVVVISVANLTWQPAVLNMIWAVIAMIALIKIKKTTKPII
jgi:hypothetical protein